MAAPHPEPRAGEERPSLAEIGLGSYVPHLMNRIMGRYTASLRADIVKFGLTTPKMRTLAVLSAVEAPLIRELAVYTVADLSTLRGALGQLQAV